MPNTLEPLRTTVSSWSNTQQLLFVKLQRFKHIWKGISVLQHGAEVKMSRAKTPESVIVRVFFLFRSTITLQLCAMSSLLAQSHLKHYTYEAQGKVIVRELKPSHFPSWTTHTHRHTPPICVWSCEVNSMAEAPISGHKSDTRVTDSCQKQMDVRRVCLCVSHSPMLGVWWLSSSILWDVAVPSGSCSNGIQTWCLGGHSESACVFVWVCSKVVKILTF